MGADGRVEIDGAEAPPTAPARRARASVDGDPIARGAALDRYIVLERIGSGGMGVVYAAYDPDLDRKVAVKLLRPADGPEPAGDRRARLMREGQALARLAHPNVVAVHDVGVFGDHVFVAMELSEGTTLTKWLSTRTRTWREIVAVFVQAGRGLAAAHAAGLVHRDFKPDNVLVSDDGKVKVLDFGLARTAGASESAPDEPGPDVPRAAQFLGEQLTQEGAVVGTPGYMAPEQAKGGALDARTDQYSFCVALHEALHGARPGAPDSRRDANVPAWLRHAVDRGLREEPSQRHPDMRALLDAITADPAVPRRRAIAIAAVVAAVGGSLLVGQKLLAPSQPAVCRGAKRWLDGVWDSARRHTVRDAFMGTRAPFAESSFNGTTRALDRFSAAWTRMRTEACEATQLHGEQSSDLLDLRMECLDRALASARERIELFARADVAIVERAVRAAESLPDLEACADVTVLRGRVRPPADPETRARVDAVYAKIARADALVAAGKYTDADPLAREASTEARELGYRPLEARADLELAEVRYHLADDAVAEATLIQAAASAEAGRDDLVAAEAWVDLVSVATSRGEYARSRERAIVARAALERLGKSDHLEARLLSYEGRNLYQEGNYDQSIATLERAIAHIEQAFGPDDLDLAGPLWNLGAALSDQGRHDEATAALQRAISVLERANGADHPSLARPLNSLGVVLTDRGKLDEARATLERVVSLQERSLGPKHPDLASTLTNLGNVHQANGGHDLAISKLQRAVEIKELSLGEWHPSVSITLGSLGASLIGTGRLDEAGAVLARAVAIKEKALGPDHQSLAFPLTSLGELAITRGRPRDALAPVERALELRTKHRVNETDLAYTRFVLARALWEVGEDRARARRLAEEARAGYRASGDASIRELGDVERWLAEHPATR